MNPQIVTIREASSGSAAEILVSQGFNCFRFTAYPGGKPVEVIYAPADFARGEGRPSRGGIPLLFPFPGRIAGTQLHWDGRLCDLAPGDALGNAIHGLVLSQPWRVIEQSESHVVGQFQLWRDGISLMSSWPADFRLTAAYSLAENLLRGEFVIENPGDAYLPFGFGTHPYFRLPLGGQSADDCIVRLPVSARWELKDMLPTGQKLEVANAAELQKGEMFSRLKFDDVFAGLQFADGWCTASIYDPSSGVTVTERFDGTFRECVVYTPPHREAICIEPYTCVPALFDLDKRGIDAGLRIIPKGKTIRAVVEIEVSAKK